MATDKLYSILNFLAVPLGGTATLPHGLILRNTPLQPDRVDLQFQDDFEFVSQTTTTLTIRNTSNVIGNCLAWVYAINPSQRLLGLQPDDGLMTQGLTPRPFVPGSPNGGSVGVSGSYVIVFRPGGVAAQNVVTTWADAVARLALLQGQRIVEFDDSIVSPIVIPAGAYDMANVIWSGGGVGTEAPIVQVVEGTTFVGLRQFDDRVIVQFTGTTPPVTDFIVAGPIQDTITLDHSARILSSGAGPFFRLSTAGGVGVAMQVRNGAAFVGGANAILDLAVAGAQVAVTAAGAESEVQSDTVSGVLGSILTVIVGGAGIADISEVQTAFLGTLTPQNITKDRRYPDGIFTANQTLSRTSEVVLVDPTGGAFNVTLPAALNNRGQSITIKNAGTSANAVTVIPAGADMIDGQPNLVLSGANFAIELTSDGTVAWYITAAGEDSGSYVVVFRPGGVASQNVVTTWTDALTRLALRQGARVLQFDDSIVTPIVIPTGGPYSMNDVTWSTAPGRISQVEIPEGASFTRLRTFAGRIVVRFTGTTPPIADLGQAPPQIDTVVIDDGAELLSQGIGPMFDVANTAQFLVGTQGAILFGTHAVVNISTASIVSVFIQGEESILGPGTFSGIVGATLNLVAAASGLFTFSQTQVAFLGTLNATNATRTRAFPSALLTVNTALSTDAATQLVLVDPTGGAFAVTLPAAVDALGQTVRLKNVSASVNIVTLTAGGGDNIDGAATLLLTGVHFHSSVTSDGVNTWYVTD